MRGDEATVPLRRVMPPLLKRRKGGQERGIGW